MTEQVEYDREADVLYVRLLEGASVSRTVPLDDLRMVDYSDLTTVVGVEFVDASAGIDLHDVPQARRVEQLIRESGLGLPIFA